MANVNFMTDILGGSVGLQADSARRLFGVHNVDVFPYNGRFLNATEVRDVIGDFTDTARGLVPASSGSATERLGGDGNWYEGGPGGGGGGFLLSEDAGTSFTAGNALAGIHKRLTATTAVAIILSNLASPGTRVAFTAATGTVTVTTSGAAGVTYRLPKVDNPGATGRTADFQITGYAELHCLRNTNGITAQWDVYGDTNHEQEVAGPVDFNGQQVFGHLRSWVTAGGLLTVVGHSGRGVITSSNIDIPAIAGFNCVLKAGGAHTVRFMVSPTPVTSAEMAAGDIMTIEVQSATAINAVRTPVANLVGFA